VGEFGIRADDPGYCEAEAGLDIQEGGEEGLD
jgi:hypothetical protein